MNHESVKAQAPLRLADHMRACVFDDRVVLLDLNRSRYLGLSGPHARIVADAIGSGTTGPDEAGASAPGAGDAISSGPQNTDDVALAAPLLQARILVAAPGPYECPQRPLAPPVASLEARADAGDPSITLIDLYRFIAATVQAALWLRLRTLQSITRAMGVRLRRCKGDGPDSAIRVRKAVAVFDWLRPLTFTSQDKCLFDSLALTIFLAHQGLSAHWVIGVSTQPFQAHSWVQHDDKVLNDLHEHVRRFTPILVV